MGAVSSIHTIQLQDYDFLRLGPRLKAWGWKSYFFMIMYRNAFPRVWSSASNSNDAAVSLAPGSYVERLIGCTKRKAQLDSYYSYPLIIKVYECFIGFCSSPLSAFPRSAGHRLIFRSEHRGHLIDMFHKLYSCDYSRCVLFCLPVLTGKHGQIASPKWFVMMGRLWE